MTDYIDIEYLRNNIIRALLQECPVKKDNPLDCQLHHLRMLSIESKDAVLKSLSNQECMDIYKKHQECLFSKTALI